MMTTHTYAVLELTANAYTEIRDKLLAAGYDHAVLDSEGEGDTELLVLDEVALACEVRVRAAVGYPPGARS